MSIFTKAFLAGLFLCGGAFAETPTTAPSGQVSITMSPDGGQVITIGPHTTVKVTKTENGNSSTFTMETGDVGGATFKSDTPGSLKVELANSAKVASATETTAPQPTQSVDPNAPVVVPFELLSSGHIAIMAKVNGKGPYRFIFDTGAPTLVMSERVAKDSGVLPRDFHKPFFTPLGNLGDFNIKSLEVGTGKQIDISTNVWNHPTVELLGKTDGPLEGLIGFPFFAHYDLAIDYKTKTLTLTPSAYKPLDTKELMTQSMSGHSVAKAPVVTEPLGLKFEKPTGDSAAGVKVTSVYTHSPADTAGIRTGDRLLTLDGRWTDTPADCAAAASSITKPGEYPLTVFRDGKTVDLKITVSPGI